MSEEIKNTAITAAGYVYQNRQGLRLLCDWLDAPTRYTRVKFECDDEAVAPKGLDDIVAERPDGLVDLEQVKYTPNPAVHALSWEWMLEKAGKTAMSRSMLRKWFDAFVALEPARVGVLSLKTNRRPDSEIEACLAGGRIDLANVPEPRRSEVIAELGDEKQCEAFFTQLQIVHSDKGFESLEHEVDSRLRLHGTPEGIANLKNVALNWAIRKSFPPPEGWISLEQVRTILRATPPAPLPEDFVVPLGYEVPDETFHREFARDTVASGGQAIVLTGPPGRGKSTYLSALCEELADLGIPTVRHHYFLSTTERGRDRVHSYVVEQSIEAQVKRFHPEVHGSGGDLRGMLEACAAYYKEQGKPFVLVLDGLDHVWRINDGDKRPLDDVFSQVIPCPDNMVLLVGTQPVDDAQLPRDLLAVAPKANWRELPAMSENAVLSYLSKAVDEGRLSTRFDDEEQSERQLQEAATLLRNKTNGHPLHVIYATAELEHTESDLSSWDIERLQGDMTKEAKFYYASLWETLPPSLKDTLRLVCAFPFFWPKAAFLEIAAKLGTAQPDVAKVEHLLHSSAAGLKVFHESLAVFVRSTVGYDERIKELMPAVASWLEMSAPTSLRVNWLWTVQARLGDPQNLITGLTRDWIMLRLEEGYPESLFETLLSEALVAALDTNSFADAYRLEHLRARMVRGSEFQMQNDDIARLVSFTLRLAADDGVVREAVASRHEADILRVAALGLALQARGQAVLARTCGDEALRRFRGLSRFSTRYTSNAGAADFQFLVDAFARLGAIGATPEAFAKLVRENGSVVWMSRARMLADEGNLDDLMDTVIPLPLDLKKSVYLRPVSDEVLKQTCEKRLARQPVLLRDDGPGACISAVLSGLDDQSEYLDPKRYAEQQSASKSWVGLGLEIGAKTIGQGLKIVSPIAGSPGALAGIQPGDMLLSVDGKDLLPLTMEQCVLALRGEEGSEAKLKLIRRNVAEPLSLDVVRTKIRVPAVRARMLTSNVAYMRVIALNALASEDMARVLAPLRSVDGLPPSGLVIDLRGNQGGLLDQLPPVAAMMTPSGSPIVRSASREKIDVLKTPDSVQRFVNHWTETVPMVVIIDERTASGAEALAQFLRESRGARLVGSATAGSTFVRIARKIGGDASVMLVTSELSSPGGVLWRNGLEPDLTLPREAVRYEYDDLRGSWLQAALNELSARLH